MESKSRITRQTARKSTAPTIVKQKSKRIEDLQSQLQCTREELELIKDENEKLRERNRKLKEENSHNRAIIANYEDSLQEHVAHLMGKMRTTPYSPRSP